MQKIVLNLGLPDDAKQQAIMTVSTLSGVDLISMDMEDKILTVIGSVDPINAVSKLREYWPTEIISVEQAVEPKNEKATKKEKPPRKGKEKKEEVMPNLVWEVVKTLPSVASLILFILSNV